MFTFHYLCTVCENRRRFVIAKSEMRFPFVSALTFRYLCRYEEGMRFGIVKSEIKFPFVSALTFRYLCKYEDRMRFGIAKSGMRFLFVSALDFRYLCKLYVYDSYNIDEWKSSEFNEI